MQNMVGWNEWRHSEPESCLATVLEEYAYTLTHMISCILSSTHYPVNRKQRWQHMRHLNEHRSHRKPTSHLHTQRHYKTHTETLTSPDTTCHPLHSCFSVLLSNVVCADIHHLDDILMSHPQAVSISPTLSLFLSFPHVGHHFINKPLHH